MRSQSRAGSTARGVARLTRASSSGKMPRSGSAPATVRMTNSEYMQPKMVRALLVAIFLVGLGLRVHHLGTFPERNRTADEYAWTWSGMTLLREGTPRAWSWMPGYGTVPL